MKRSKEKVPPTVGESGKGNEKRSHLFFLAQVLPPRLRLRAIGFRSRQYKSLSKDRAVGESGGGGQ